MQPYCQDRDLLAVEPEVFATAGSPGQLLARGDGAALTGGVLTAPGADFVAAGAKVGMVLATHAGAAGEADAWEIVSIDSPTQLSVSVLRADAADAPVAPPDAADLHWRVRTYAAQIRLVSAALGEKLRQMIEVAGVASAAFADSAQLRQCAAHGTLASIFAARAERAHLADANWNKALRHREQFARRRIELRLAVDADGDGFAEQTRTLAGVRLRRA